MRPPVRRRVSGSLPKRLPPNSDSNCFASVDQSSVVWSNVCVGKEDVCACSSCVVAYVSRGPYFKKIQRQKY